MYGLVTTHWHKHEQHQFYNSLFQNIPALVPSPDSYDPAGPSCVLSLPPDHGSALSHPWPTPNFIVCASPSEILHTLLSLFYGKTFTNHLLTKIVKQCVNKQFMSFPGPSSPLSWPGITHLLSHACFQEHHDAGFDRNCDFPPAALEMLLQGSSKSWLFSPFV